MKRLGDQGAQRPEEALILIAVAVWADYHHGAVDVAESQRDHDPLPILVDYLLDRVDAADVQLG